MYRPAAVASGPRGRGAVGTRATDRDGVRLPVDLHRFPAAFALERGVAHRERRITLAGGVVGRYPYRPSRSLTLGLALASP